MAAAAMPSADSSAVLGATSSTILQGGWEAARVLEPPIEGRSTGCVVTVELKPATGAGILNATVLGDSGFMVLAPPGRDSTRRGWTVRYTCDEERIEEQQHYFNCPFQLGTLGGGEMNTPADAFQANFSLECGDVVIVATDGLFDTLFAEDIVKMFDEYARIHVPGSCLPFPASRCHARFCACVAPAVHDEEGTRLLIPISFFCAVGEQEARGSAHST